MKPTLLITGGAGYIGSHAVKLFLLRGYRVVVFDNLSRGYEEPIAILRQFGDIEFVRGDLEQKEGLNALFSTYQIDAVFHFAAFCSVNESMEYPERYFYNNTIGSLNLFEAMRSNDVRTIIFSSTCATYGNALYVPVDEKHPQNPSNPYGESKFFTERALRWYGELHRFKYVILRYFNVCGTDSEGAIGDSKRPSLLLVQNAVRGALGIEPFLFTCPRVDTPDGTPVRDYIDVRDLVDAHASAYDYLRAGGVSDVFNLGTGRGYSVKEIVREVEREFGTTMEKQDAEPRKGEYAVMYAEIEKATRVLAWKPTRSLGDSIVSLRKWYTHHPHGYTL